MQSSLIVKWLRHLDSVRLLDFVFLRNVTTFKRNIHIQSCRQVTLQRGKQRKLCVVQNSRRIQNQCKIQHSREQSCNNNNIIRCQSKRTTEFADCFYLIRKFKTIPTARLRLQLRPLTPTRGSALGSLPPDPSILPTNKSQIRSCEAMRVATQAHAMLQNLPHDTDSRQFSGARGVDSSSSCVTYVITVYWTDEKIYFYVPPTLKTFRDPCTWVSL